MRGGSTIGAMTEGLAIVLGAGIARGVSTGGAIGKVTAALVEGCVAATRASGVACAGGETVATACAGEEGVAASCATALATVVAAFVEIDTTAFASAIGAAGLANAVGLADAAGDATGFDGVGAGLCDDATMEAPLVRLDASGGCARAAVPPAEGDGRGALFVRASCVRRDESAGRAFDARPAVGVEGDGVRAIGVERGAGLDR